MVQETVNPAATVAWIGKGGRARLLAEAVQLLSREGVHGMSIGKLAERTGYSKGGIMAHFGSKRELVIALVAEAMERTRTFLHGRLERLPTATERLTGVLAAYGSYWTEGVFEGGCPFLNLAVHAVDPQDEIAAAVREAARGLVADLADIVRTGQAAGEFRPEVDPEDVGERVLSLCIGAGWTYRMTADATIFARLEPTLERLVQNISAASAVEAGGSRTNQWDQTHA
jgi:AcrR family transcriptional regulator